MDKQLFDIARAGHPVLTANNRLARYLLRQYEAAQQNLGHRAWPRPAILPFSAWLGAQVELLPPLAAPLSELQELFLWERIIERDLTAELYPSFQLGATARRVREAHVLATRYGATFEAAQGASDQRMFLQWQSSWRNELNRMAVPDPAARLWSLADAVGQGAVTCPARLTLAGFDDLPPDMTHLLDVLARQGCEINHWQPEGHVASSRMLLRCADVTDEITHCARWVRQLLLAGETRIGVVAPRLDDYRAAIQTIFQAELDPEAVLSGSDRPEPFSLSLGMPLAREGVVRAALRLLSLAPPLDQHDVYWLLRSPFLGDSQVERSARAMAEVRLRETGAVEWSLGQLLRQLESFRGVGGFVARLNKVRRMIEDRTPRRPGEWAERFALMLEACGWPGERSPDSREFQAIQHFRGVLGDLASLDRVAQPVGRMAAFSVLSRRATETVFQPEAPDAQVQVLGLLEAAGMDFQHLWVLGMHDAVLPAAPSPNPFLPLFLQRQKGMPRADAERERQFAFEVTGRLFTAAPRVIASYPGQAEGSERRPSPCLVDFEPARLMPLPGRADPAEVLLASQPVLEVLQDNTAKPIVSRKAFSGGTALIKDQALCPFRAFAHHRLKAKGLELPDVGIDNMARGTLVHTALELFWKEVRSQEALLSLEPSGLDKLLTACSEHALGQLERARRRDIASQLRRLEQKRLVRLCREWLDFEMSRPAFAVDEVEKLHHETIGRLKIRTKVDRIDRLSDDSLMIIDYKTGRSDPVDWFGDRVAEPQLPIYCLGQADAELAAVVFASVRPDDCGFKGIGRSLEDVPGMTQRSWSNLLEKAEVETLEHARQHWRDAIPKLGDEFADGLASVAPVDPVETCRYCDLIPFCRIHESGSDLTGGAADA